METNKTFFDLFNEFEDWARQNYRFNEIADLEKKPDFRYDNAILHNLRHIRNVIYHTSDLITVNQSAIDQLKKFMNSHMNAKSAIEIAIPISEMVYRQWDEPVDNLIELMQKNDYTHVPILKGQTVWGLFSKDTIFKAYAGNNMDDFANNQTTFIQMKNIVSLSSIKDKRYQFVAKNESVLNIKKYFIELREAGEKVDILFVTDNKNQNEPLLGIITAWDIVAY